METSGKFLVWQEYPELADFMIGINPIAFGIKPDRVIFRKCRGRKNATSNSGALQPTQCLLIIASNDTFPKPMFSSLMKTDMQIASGCVYLFGDSHFPSSLYVGCDWLAISLVRLAIFPKNGGNCDYGESQKENCFHGNLPVEVQWCGRFPFGRTVERQPVRGCSGIRSDAGEATLQP